MQKVADLRIVVLCSLVDIYLRFREELAASVIRFRIYGSVVFIYAVGVRKYTAKRNIRSKIVIEPDV